jgi:glycosyltransferase involved in cell wall biosynthesis
MRIAYANANYRPNSPGGHNAHIRQFIDNAIDSGHDVWVWPSNHHPKASKLPLQRFQRLSVLRTMDAIITRIENKLPEPAYLRWSQFPVHQLVGSPIIVWEFNTVPEFGLIRGRSAAEVKEDINQLRKYGRSCDLAICVSNALSDYVKHNLEIDRVLTVPNGSDPNLFHPQVPPVERLLKYSEQLNVVWIGSANLSWHNFDLLNKTAHILFQDRSHAAQKITFHIIGHAHALMREMSANVIYHGSENYEYLPNWLSAMDVGLCLYCSGPADYSSPLKVFDYMASGLTVVGTVQPQLQEICEQLEQLDLLSPPDDPQALAKILLSLVENPDRLIKQAQKGRQLVIDHYNWARAVQETMAKIQRIKSERIRKY